MCKKLLLAVAISVFAAVVADSFVPRPRRCGHDTKWIMKGVDSALVHWQVEHDSPCPPSLQALVDEGILVRVPVDAWGRPFLFDCPGRFNPDGADLVSAGRDGRFWTADDIYSWDQ